MTCLPKVGMNGGDRTSQTVYKKTARRPHYFTSKPTW